MTKRAKRVTLIVFACIVVVGVTVAVCLYARHKALKALQPIPDGYYYTHGPTTSTYVKGNGNQEVYWYVKGYKASFYISGALHYKCNIVEEDGKIYFEGYIWVDWLNKKEYGKEFKWEVVYDKDAQSITVLVSDNS